MYGTTKLTIRTVHILHKSQSQLNWVELVALYLIYHFSGLILSQNLTWMVLPSSVLIDKFSWTKLMFYLMFTTPIPSKVVNRLPRKFKFSMEALFDETRSTVYLARVAISRYPGI